MRVDGYSGLQGTGPLDPNKKEGLAGTSQAQPAGSPQLDAEHDVNLEDATDTIEISAKAREVLAGGAVSTANETSAIRPEAVERARKLLQSGLYNDHGVLEKTADKIAGLFSTDA